MRQKLSAESVIAATVASFRSSTTSAHDIAKAIVCDLKYFGYDIQLSAEISNRDWRGVLLAL